MSVQLSPATALGFNRPLTILVKRILTVTNRNSLPVAFKVKTTAPKLYCVRPNSGRIEPGESVEVQVLLQAMKEEPPLNAKCKDKFLVQSMFITPDKENTALQDLWQLEEGDPAEIHQQKIKVLYLPPEGQTVEEGEEDMSFQRDPSRMFSFDDSRYQTMRPPPIGNGHQPMPPFETSHDLPGLDRGASPAPDFFAAHDTEEHAEPSPWAAVPAPASMPYSSTVEPPTSQAYSQPKHGSSGVNLVDIDIPEPAPAPRAATPAPPAENHEAREAREAAAAASAANMDLVSKLKDAEAEIQNLRALLASMPEPTLRRRNKALSDDGTVAETEADTVVDSAVAEPIGVPPQVVAIIALAVFTLTYLFF